jgi:hypothetical protein
MSRASRAMQRACSWHGSGKPLTAMYLSPTVSTCHENENNHQRLSAKFLLFYWIRQSKRLSGYCKLSWTLCQLSKHVAFFFFVALVLPIILAQGEKVS